MKFLDSIMHGIRMDEITGTTIPGLMKNPNQATIINALRGAPEHILKGLIEDNGTLWLAPAMSATHEMMKKQLGFDPNGNDADAVVIVLYPDIEKVGMVVVDRHTDESYSTSNEFNREPLMRDHIFYRLPQITRLDWNMGDRDWEEKWA